MSRCYLDTNFLYVHLRAERSQAPPALVLWCERVLAQATSSGATISALVQDELAYRLILAWLRDDGVEDPLSHYREETRATMRAMRTRLQATWQALDSLALELQPTDAQIVERARALMARPGLPPRDAFHAAHALVGDCATIASTDASFDAVPGLRRLAP